MFTSLPRKKNTDTGGSGGPDMPIHIYYGMTAMKSQSILPLAGLPQTVSKSLLKLTKNDINSPSFCTNCQIAKIREI